MILVTQNWLKYSKLQGCLSRMILVTCFATFFATSGGIDTHTVIRKGSTFNKKIVNCPV